MGVCQYVHVEQCQKSKSCKYVNQSERCVVKCYRTQKCYKNVIQLCVIVFRAQEMRCMRMDHRHIVSIK